MAEYRDLKDGEQTEMKGSARKPYILRNVGGVYSCTCPAWRNQSEPIERRTCKHLRKLRGDAAEKARLGAPLPERAKAAGENAPPLLLAHTWEEGSDPTGYWMSEKLDGVRALWDGKQLISRLGNLYLAPDGFTEALPDVALDGELFTERGAFQQTVSIVRRKDASPELWKAVTFLVFDAPQHAGLVEARWAYLRELLTHNPSPHVRVLEQKRCEGPEHLAAELERIEALGGEGVMLREAGSRYEAGRSTTLYKVKTFHDAEARVVGYTAGAGRHKGRTGALKVATPAGVVFSVGTGLSDAERNAPPALGSIITYRYQELTDAGVPRFPSYVGLRHDYVWPADAVDVPLEHPKKKKKKKASKSKAASSTAPITLSAGARRFEFHDGGSAKFWTVDVQESAVVVHYGKIDTQGQTRRKALADPAAAQAHAQKQIAKKVDKGYAEVS